MREHKDKKSKSAKYMRYFTSFELVYSETCKSRTEAMKRERQIKQWKRSRKEALISGSMTH